MTDQPEHSGAAVPGGRWFELAQQAAADVNTRFGHTLAGVPGTWLGALEAPTSGAPRAGSARPWIRTQWHYWWQAHYLDAVIDSAFLALAQGHRSTARAELGRAKALLRGIWLRNGCHFPNYFFDDMAWLALAAGRLNALSLRLTAKPSRLARYATKILTRQLHSSHDAALGGGLYWSRKRDFKNTPVNGPAALHFARNGEPDMARALADWLHTELFDPATGLYLDGVHPTPTGRTIETTIYTYNQGPILAALLALGTPADLADAAALIDAIAHQLGTPGRGLRLEPGGGDGSLFTGILCRYLALAAQDEKLPAHGRATASTLVMETAAALAGQEATQLSAAIQRWMIRSAAAG